jgi:hypothetical protein
MLSRRNPNEQYAIRPPGQATLALRFLRSQARADLARPFRFAVHPDDFPAGQERVERSQLAAQVAATFAGVGGRVDRHEQMFAPSDCRATPNPLATSCVDVDAVVCGRARSASSTRG